jgi:hypothetical protein
MEILSAYRLMGGKMRGIIPSIKNICRFHLDVFAYALQDLPK